MEENEKGERKGIRERDFRQSVPLSACFGNTECVSEAKRIGSFLLVLLACFRLLAFAGVLALLASVASPALLDLTCLPCLAFPRLLACCLLLLAFTSVFGFAFAVAFALACAFARCCSCLLHVSACLLSYLPAGRLAGWAGWAGRLADCLLSLPRLRACLIACLLAFPCG